MEIARFNGLSRDLPEKFEKKSLALADLEIFSQLLFRALARKPNCMLQGSGYCPQVRHI